MYAAARVRCVEMAKLAVFSCLNALAKGVADGLLAEAGCKDWHFWLRLLCAA